MRDDADWIDRAKSMTIAQSPPVPNERDGTVIVAAPDTALAADICLQTGIGSAEHPACLVATAVSPADLEAYVTERAPTQPAMGFVDATSERPSPASKAELQTVENIPSVHDLLQLTTAVSDVRETIAPRDQPTNIVVPAFDSLLQAAPTNRVVRVLSHIAESNQADGRVVIGLDYTQGSIETLQTLKEHTTALLWAERDSSGDVTLDFEPLRH